ncbi:MAG: hypothetical protein AAF349_27655 [Cyanobacteria bacterium P01_A01_bin.68]
MSHITLGLSTPFFLERGRGGDGEMGRWGQGDKERENGLFETTREQDAPTT